MNIVHSYSQIMLKQLFFLQNHNINVMNENFTTKLIGSDLYLQ